MSGRFNHVAVFLAVVAQVALGFLWYSAALFGPAWLAGLGVDPQQAPQAGPAQYGLAILTAIGAAYFLAFILHAVRPTGAIKGLVWGLLFGVFGVGLTMAMHYAFAGRSISFLLVEVGQAAIGYGLAGLILGAWPAKGADRRSRRRRRPGQGDRDRDRGRDRGGRPERGEGDRGGRPERSGKPERSGSDRGSRQERSGKQERGGGDRTSRQERGRGDRSSRGDRRRRGGRDRSSEGVAKSESQAAPAKSESQAAPAKSESQPTPAKPESQPAPAKPESQAAPAKPEQPSPPTTPEA